LMLQRVNGTRESYELPRRRRVYPVDSRDAIRSRRSFRAPT
jgi:hypothetical protein